MKIGRNYHNTKKTQILNFLAGEDLEYLDVIYETPDNSGIVELATLESQAHGYVYSPRGAKAGERVDCHIGNNVHWFNYVDGSGGGGSGNFVYNETPSGDIDDSNNIYTLDFAPSPSSSLKLFLNGQLLTQGQDYTLAGVTITMNDAPDTGSVLRAFYERA